MGGETKMCQLLGVSASEPIRLRFGWRAFAQKGSVKGGNPDGWGVAYYGQHDALLLRDPNPASASPMVKFLAGSAPPSSQIISHVRRATTGAIRLENTQPFVRYLGGRAHLFAHNGFVSSIDSTPGLACLRAVGDTDSERLFMRLLASLAPLWQNTGLPSLDARLAVIDSFATAHRVHGALNFLYCDGENLFAHGHRHTVPGDVISTDPGLYVLEIAHQPEAGPKVPCEGLQCDGIQGPYAVVATMPLDNQRWSPLRAGEIACYERGLRIR
jgi:glutamine amidotransferase